MKIKLAKHTITLLALAATAAGCSKPQGGAPDLQQTRLLNTRSAQGSMGPNLATGPDGSIVLSWIEPDGDGDALRFSVLEDGNWATARTVASGENWYVNWADFPSVVPVSESVWAAHWMRRQAGDDWGYAYDIRIAFSYDAGESWADAFTPHTDGTDTEHGFVSFFPDRGGVGMIWLDGRKMINDYDENDVGGSGMTLRGATFGADTVAATDTLVDDLICDCCQTDVAVTSDGPVAVYRDRTVAEIRDIQIARFADGAWQSGEPVGDDNWEIFGCPVNGPVVEANGAELAVAWFSAHDGVSTVQLARSGDAGHTLSDAVSVAAGGLLGHVGAVLLTNGDTVVSWLANAQGGIPELHIRRVAVDGKSGPDRVVTEASGVSAFSVPQIVLVEDKLLLAWTDTTNEDSRVKTAMVPLQFLD